MTEKDASRGMAVWTIIIALLTSVVAVSGCFGGGAKNAAVGDGDPTDTYVEPTAGPDTGGIKGIVMHQEEITFIPGVRVGFLNEELTDLTTTTNDQGLFGFSEITPGKFTLAFSKSGFHPVTRNVEVVADDILELVVELSPVKPEELHEPFDFHPSPREGKWGCAVGMPLRTQDYCSGNTVTGGDVRNVVEFAKHPDQNITGFMLGVRWESTSIASGQGIIEIQLPIEVKNAKGADVSSDDMKSYLIACEGCSIRSIEAGWFITINAENDFVVYVKNVHPDSPMHSLLNPRGTSYNITVNLAKGDATDPATWGGVAHEQQFTAAAYWMYWGFEPENVGNWRSTLWAN